MIVILKNCIIFEWAWQWRAVPLLISTRSIKYQKYHSVTNSTVFLPIARRVQTKTIEVRSPLTNHKWPKVVYSINENLIFAVSLHEFPRLKPTKHKFIHLIMSCLKTKTDSTQLWLTFANMVTDSTRRSRILTDLHFNVKYTLCRCERRQTVNHKQLCKNFKVYCAGHSTRSCPLTFDKHRKSVTTRCCEKIRSSVKTIHR